MQHPTCEICKHADLSANKARPWMRSCAINNLEWHKDDYCSNYSEPMPDFESLLKAERSKVVQEVREWTLNHAPMIYTTHLMRKLDSMEPDKEDGE